MFARATLLRAPAAGLALGFLVLLAFLSPAEAASTPASRWRYRSNADLAAAMDALHAGPCSGMSSLVSIGTSVKGTEIRVLEVSADPGRTQAKPSFLFLGNMHGDEPVGRELILRLAELICVAASASGDADTKNADGVITVVEQGDEHFHEAARSLATTSRLFFVPSINPDGFENRARNNARGVDLNRDWPDQFVSFATGGTDEGSGGSTTKGSGGNNEGATTSTHGDSTTSTTFGSSTVLSETGGGWMADLPHKRQPETAALMKLSRTLNATAGLNFHEGAVVANYPWDAKDGSTKRSVYAPAPDDATFKRLASAYANGHPQMHHSKEFPGGITNGAQWYPLWGGMQDWHYLQTQTLDITIEVNDEKWPKEGELGKIWREHVGGIFACALMATRGAVKGFVRDAASNEALPTAVLKIEGVDIAFAPNALGFFARPVSGNSEKDAGKNFAVTVTASADGYTSVTETVSVHQVEGGEVVFALRKGSGGGGGNFGSSRDDDGLEDDLFGSPTPTRRDPATVRGLAATVGGPHRHPETTWGAAAFVVLAVAATVRRRRARLGRGRGVVRVEGV